MVTVRKYRDKYSMDTSGYTAYLTWTSPCTATRSCNIAVLCITDTPRKIPFRVAKSDLLCGRKITRPSVAVSTCAKHNYINQEMRCIYILFYYRGRLEPGFDYRVVTVIWVPNMIENMCLSCSHPTSHSVSSSARTYTRRSQHLEPFHNGSM